MSVLNANLAFNTVSNTSYNVGNTISLGCDYTSAISIKSSTLTSLQLGNSSNTALTTCTLGGIPSSATTSQLIYYNSTTGDLTYGALPSVGDYASEGTGTGTDNGGTDITTVFPGALTNTAAGTGTMITVAGTLAFANSCFGAQSLTSLIDLATNISNNAFGFGSAHNLLYGADNNFIGEGAGLALTGGVSGTPAPALRNVAIGSYALGRATTTTIGVVDNIAIGFKTLNATAFVGVQNIAIGSNSLTAITNGAGNIAIGFNAMLSSTGANYNIAMGHQALSANLGGGGNIALGYQALSGATTPSGIVVVGHNAGTTAFTSGGQNGSVLIGQAADGLNASTEHAICINAVGTSVKSDTNEIRILTSTTYTTGTTFIGGIASASPGTASAVFINSTTGQLGTNVAIATAGGALTTSYTIGANALTTFAVGGTGVTSVDIGSSSTATNTVAIGSNTTTTVNIGGSAATAINIGAGANTSATTCTIGGIVNSTPSTGTFGVVINSSGVLGAIVSSARFKDNIVPIEKSVIDRIYDLEPVRFNYKAHDASDLQYGLIAEEVHKILPEFVVYKDSLPYTVAYQFLTPVLLSVVKNQKTKIESLEQRILALESKFSNL